MERLVRLMPDVEEPLVGDLHQVKPVGAPVLDDRVAAYREALLNISQTAANRLIHLVGIRSSRVLHVAELFLDGIRGNARGVTHALPEVAVHLLGSIKILGSKRNDARRLVDLISRCLLLRWSSLLVIIAKAEDTLDCTDSRLDAADDLA